MTKDKTPDMQVVQESDPLCNCFQTGVLERSNYTTKKKLSNDGLRITNDNMELECVELDRR